MVRLSVIILVVALIGGCKSFYENAGMHVRTGSIMAPIELADLTDSLNCRFLFFLTGIDLYTAKGCKAEMKYEQIDAGSWLSGASTQKCEVVITPEHIPETNATANFN